MIIKLSPQNRPNSAVYVKAGDTISVNGEVFDFSRIQDGDTLPKEAISSDWFGGGVERVGGELVITLTSPLPSNYSQEQAFPSPVIMHGDGEVPLPQPLPEILETLKEVEVE